MFDVQSIAVGSDIGIEANYSVPLALETTPIPDGAPLWGDVVGSRIPSGRWDPPNGALNVNDIQSVLFAFQKRTDAPIWVWVDNDHGAQNHIINVTDLQLLLLAFQGRPYPHCGPIDCVSDWHIPDRASQPNPCP